jgi:hypothetical protein
METGTTIERRRGRPRIDAPPRSDVHARLPPELKARLERDAKRAHRSVAKEFEIRLQRSYVQDEMYGGAQMAAMFREMAEIGLGYAKYKNRGSFFEDFEVFVFVRNVWQAIIRRHMPRPREELLAEVSREWDTFKAGSPLTAAQEAAQEWLIHHTTSRLTLAQVLTGAFKPRIGRSGRPSEPESDNLATPEIAATRESAMPSEPLFCVSTVPPIGSLGKAIEGLIPSEGTADTTRSGNALWPIGSIAKAMEGLLPSQGSARAAAGENSRLAELLADATEETAGTAVAPTRPVSGIEKVRKKSNRQVSV